ncbi:MAG: hypothetical protein ABI433_13890 [Burkholderiaceae bacterium]
MNQRILSLGALLVLCSAQAALAAQITVLSAGAIEPGIRPALTAFEQASGHSVSLAFATAHRRFASASKRARSSTC